MKILIPFAFYLCFASALSPVDNDSGTLRLDTPPPSYEINIPTKYAGPGPRYLPPPPLHQSYYQNTNQGRISKLRASTVVQPQGFSRTPKSYEQHTSGGGSTTPWAQGGLRYDPTYASEEHSLRTWMAGRQGEGQYSQPLEPRLSSAKYVSPQRIEDPGSIRTKGVKVANVCSCMELPQGYFVPAPQPQRRAEGLESEVESFGNVGGPGQKYY